MQINWAVIGCGSVTELKSVPAFMKVDGFEVVGCYRRDSKKADDYVKRFNLKKRYDSVDELINDDIVDAIYIATPPDSHKKYAFKVAEAKKICVIEKPMAVNYSQAKEIFNRFKVDNLPLFISYYRRSLPRFLKVKEWIDGGLIGNIRDVNWIFHKIANEIDLSKRDNWRTKDFIAKGGYFDDVGSHGLDLLNFLLGDIIDAKGFCVNQQNLYTSYDSISACWLHQNKITGTGNWNFGSYKREDIVTIYGDKGKIVFSALDEHPIELITEAKHQKLFIQNPKNIQLYHAKNIKEHLLGNIIHPSLGESGLHANWVMDKILDSIK